MAKTSKKTTFGDPRGARLRRLLFGRIERLEDKIRIERELIEVQQKRRDDLREAKVSHLANTLKKELYPLELSLLPEDQAIAERIRVQLPSLHEKQRLAYRKQRQDLRRSEGLLDAKGRLLPDAKDLSPSAVAALDALSEKQREEQSRLEVKIANQVKKNTLSAAERTSRQARYEQEMQVQHDRVNTLNDSLKAADDVAMERIRNKQTERVRALETKRDELHKRLLASEHTAQHHLPDDIILRLENLSMTFGGLKAVDNLSFDIKKGEIFGLIGPNGAGKTTVFNCITQFYKPTDGQILYRTREGNVLSLTNYDVHDIITKGIVRTFQNVEIVGELSIMDNLLVAAHRQYNSGLFAQMLNTRRVKQEEMVMRERALKVLDYLDLTPIKELSPLGQPYGILKRIELARTLIAGANLIILDEPAAGLNDQETLDLVATIRQIQKDFDVTIFLVEHNMGLVMDVCDHICAISFGKKLAYGTPQEIQNDPVVQEAYLGTQDTEEAS